MLKYTLSILVTLMIVSPIISAGTDEGIPAKWLGGVTPNLIIELLGENGAGECYDTLKTQFEEFKNGTNPTPFLGTFINSGKSMNEYGDAVSCQSNPKNYTYKQIKINFNGIDTLMGLCLPVQCTTAELEVIAPLLEIQLVKILDYLDEYNVPGGYGPRVKASVVEPQVSHGMGSFGWYVVALISPWGVLVLASTAKDTYNLPELTPPVAAVTEGREDMVKNFSNLEIPQPDKELADSDFLSCFSLIQNWRLFSSTSITVDKNLEVFNFVKVFGLIFLAYTHTFVLELLVQGNILESYLTYGDYLTVVILSGYYCVDLLFFVAGAVGGYCLLTKLDQVGNRFSAGFYLKAVLHRFLRLWPMYMLVMFFFWQVSSGLFQGPVWTSYLNWTNSCNGNWWRNVLLIDNWTGSLTENSKCMMWGWYISADLQMFLLLPILMAVYRNSSVAGNLMAGFLILFGLIVSFVMSYQNNVFAYLLPKYYPYGTATKQDVENFMSYSYFATYAHMATYYLGAVFGYYYFTWKRHNGQGNSFFSALSSKFRARVVLYVCVALLLFLIYYLIHQEANTPDTFGKFVNAFFAADVRFIWVLCVLAFIIPAILVQESLLKSIMGHTVWKPLARLGLSWYLIHTVIILVRNYANQKAPYIGAYFMFQEWIIVCCYSLAISLAMVLVFELPLKRLEDNFLMRNYSMKSYDENKLADKLK